MYFRFGSLAVIFTEVVTLPLKTMTKAYFFLFFFTDIGHLCGFRTTILCWPWKGKRWYSHFICITAVTQQLLHIATGWHTTQLIKRPFFFFFCYYSFFSYSCTCTATVKSEYELSNIMFILDIMYLCIHSRIDCRESKTLNNSQNFQLITIVKIKYFLSV